MAWSTERSPSGTTLNETSTGQLSPSFRRTYAPSGQRVVPSTVPADTGTSASLVLAGVTKVNSIHHQAVLDPGERHLTGHESGDRPDQEIGAEADANQQEGRRHRRQRRQALRRAVDRDIGHEGDQIDREGRRHREIVAAQDAGRCGAGRRLGRSGHGADIERIGPERNARSALRPGQFVRKSVHAP